MRHVFRHRHLKTVIVTLKTGTSFRGVLFDIDADALVLRNVEALSPREGATAVDGELILDRANVEYVQRP